jgi:hypothetical protein
VRAAAYRLIPTQYWAQSNPPQSGRGLLSRDHCLARTRRSFLSLRRARRIATAITPRRRTPKTKRLNVNPFDNENAYSIVPVTLALGRTGPQTFRAGPMRHATPGVYFANLREARRVPVKRALRGRALRVRPAAPTRVGSVINSVPIRSIPINTSVSINRSVFIPTRTPAPFSTPAHAVRAPGVTAPYHLLSHAGGCCLADDSGVGGNGERRRHAEHSCAKRGGSNERDSGLT